MSYTRRLRTELPPGQSTYLWGPRKVGKSTMLREAFAGSLSFDLLDSQIRFDLLKRPNLLREWIAAAPLEQQRLPIIIDEVQKVPELLEEIQFLIESRRLSFILCGSSARKLRRGQANLLGGRAWRMEMFPLVSAEVPDFDLLRALRHGLIPSHYLSPQPNRSLRAYLDDYLKEEIAAEALTRNLGSFARFLDLVGIMNTEIVNYTNIASEVHVDAKTVKSYFEILVDTLLGRFIEPLTTKQGSRKALVVTPKFYLFDPGVARALRRVDISAVKGAEAGHLFETFIAHELFAARAYLDCDVKVNFYRTRGGAEIDFLLDGGRVAIEAKISSHVRAEDLRSLNAFLDEHPETRALVVCTEERARVVELGKRRIEILPWRDFCRQLWAGQILA